MRYGLVVLPLCLVLTMPAACGEDGDAQGATTTAAGGSTSTGSPDGGGGEAASGGEGGLGGAAGVGGATGGGGDGGAGGDPCDDLSCSVTCPRGNWDDLEGCPTCACAAELAMEIGAVAKPVAMVDFSVMASEFIGGIDRWVFDFKWEFVLGLDAGETVDATVRLMRVDPLDEPDETNDTYFVADAEPLETMPSSYGTVTIAGLQTTELSIESGFLSIRRVGDTFQGHIYLDLVPSIATTPATVHVSAPFEVPVPAS